MKKNIIVVTGGAGFIGSSLIKYLIKIGVKEKIISIDNYSSGYVKNHIKNINVKYIKGENKNIETLLKIYKKKIKIIFHFGEFSRIYQSFKNYKKCFDYNIHHSSKVIEFAKDNKINFMIKNTAMRNKLAKNGKLKYHSKYNSLVVADFMIKKIFNIDKKVNW